MSLYTFATSNFTTLDDIHRKPAVNTWQIVRTLAFLISAFVTLVYVARSPRPVDVAGPHVHVVATAPIEATTPDL